MKPAVVLIVFGGLPGTGKTTISRALAKQMSAVHLRVDSIEQAIRDADVLADGIGTAGYVVAQTIAEANLADGLVVIVDCVNPVVASREGWRRTAARAAVRLVEVVCSDIDEHRRRVEARVSDISGLVMPTWKAIRRHDYEAWDRPHVVVDSTTLSPEAAIALLRAHLA